jgi:hypothetical protein
MARKTHRKAGKLDPCMFDAGNGVEITFWDAPVIQARTCIPVKKKYAHAQ